MSSSAATQRLRQGILLIAYHFPPSSAVGGMRVANFARHLASFGWEPHVLTIRDEDIEDRDPERRQGLEGIGVSKARVLPTVNRLYSSLRRGMARRHTHQPASSPPVPAPRITTAGSGERGSARIKRYINSFLMLPDGERGWILPATMAAIRLIRQRRIGWIMTSCPPYTGHVVGLAVSTLTRTKWVADFRDPWMTTGSKRLFPTSAVSLRIESWLERKVIERADLVLFNVERLRNAYRARYSEVPGEKFVFIPNAITPRVIPERARAEKYERFTLCYTGSLYVGRSPEPVFQALARLIAEGTTTAEAVRLELVGHCNTINGVPTSAVVRRYGLESVVVTRGSVPYAEAMELVTRSHLALLLAPDLPFQIPAKVYDYLGAGTRILAIADDGGTADLVRETGSGRAFSSDDADGIAKFIHDEMTSRRPVDGSGQASLARFDVRRITEELVGHLSRVGAPSGGASFA